MAITEAERIKQNEIAEQLLKNKLLSSSNFLNYTGLTYEDIITVINSKIASDRRFDNFRESGIAQLMLEIFAGCTDLVNYNIERNAEESFFDSAKLKSSLILLARNLAYDIKRPIPAQCRIKVILAGNFSSSTFSIGDIVQIPQYTNFNIESNNFLLMRQFNYTLTANDLDQGSDYKKEIYYNESDMDEDINIKLLQGERKTITITGTLSPYTNQVFQKYFISDKTFSNLYGEQDLVSPLTEIGIGTDINSAFPNGISEWEIDRRTLLRTDSIENYDFLSEVQTAKKICLIRTAIDEGIELLFGDDKYVSKGLKSSDQNIYIKYLSTLGTEANKTGMIGKIPSILNSVTLRSVDITNQISFELISNITMGSDIESNEAIKVNAPAIFYTLDRLVSKQDYVNFLESLSNPITIKNAIAWGEQEEIKLGQLYDDQTRVAIRKLFNVVLFCAIGSLYNTGTTLTEFSEKTNLSEENVVLDSDYKDDEINSQSYFNLLTISDNDGGNIVEEVRNQTIISQGSNTTNSYIVINSSENNQDIYDWRNYKSSDDSITIYYTSAENISAYNSSEVSNFNITMTASNFTSFDNMCSWITTEINSKSILPDDFLCTYDNLNNIFTFKHLKVSGSNYIVDVHDYNSYNDSYKDCLKMERDTYGKYETITFFDSNISYSQSISEVLKQLNKRSQITIKNVYITPIVQNFELTGTVYVSSLIDKDQMKTKIYNKIYSWLDEKTDFGTEFYKSNIVELIESFPSVSRADVDIQPKSIERSDGLSHFKSGLDSSYNIDYSLNQETMNRSIYWKCLAYGYSSELSYSIAKIFEEEIIYFTNNNLLKTDNIYNEYNSSIVWNVVVNSSSNEFNNKITERYFYSKLAKKIYDRLKVEINNDYYQSSLFRVDISNVHKDLSNIIKLNMMDSNGNIAPEYSTVVVSNKELKKLIKGGYSLGNEIVKLKVNLQVIYK